MTLWQIGFFMVCTDLVYFALFARLGLWHCLAVNLFSLSLQFVLMAFLWTNHVTLAKCVIVFNWVASCCLITLVLSSESGMWVMAAPFSLV